MKTLVKAALVALVAVPLVACGGGDPEGEAPRTPATGQASGASESTAVAEAPDPADAGDTDAVDFCDLLTPAEVAAATGSAMQDGQSVRENTCSWLPVDASTGVGVSVFYVRYGPTTVAAACASGVAGMPDPTAVPGIGDEAHWFVEETEIASAGGLWICLEEATLNVAVSGARSGADLQEVAVALADTLIPRI